MASMKLVKSGHGYGANQNKMSQYQYQGYNMSQPSQSHQCRLGLSMHAFNQFDHACANNSTRYHAHSNSVLPSPLIHVTQTLKRQESNTDQQWSAKNDACTNSAQSSYSVSGAMYNDSHRIGKIQRVETLKRQESHTEQQWATKNDTNPNPSSSYSAGGAMYDDAHQIGKTKRAETMKREDSHTDQQWAAKNNTFPVLARSNYSTDGTMLDDAHGIATMDHGLANKATQFLSYGQTNHHGQSMLNSQDVKSYKYNTNVYDGECLSPMNANQHGQTMFKEQGEQSYDIGKNSYDGDWSTSPKTYSGSNQCNHLTQNEYMQQDHHGWNDKANKFSGSAEMGHSNHTMHQEGLVMGSNDQSWLCSPTQHNQSSLVMHKNNHLTENLDHALVKSPTRAKSSTFNMNKEEHMLSDIDGGFGMKSTNYSDVIKARQYQQSKYMGQGQTTYSINDHGIYGGQSKNFGHPYQYGSSHAMYDRQDQYGHSAYQGQAEDVFNFNDYDSQSNCISKPGHKQYNYSSNNIHKGQEQYGSMMSHSGHLSYNKHDEYENGNVDEIMDEILSKYPAHNIGSGCGSSASCPKQYSYASSTSSSSAKKFETRGMMNNEGFYNNGF